MGRSLAVLRMLCASSCLLLCAYGCGSSSPIYSGAVVVAQDFMLDSYFTVAFADFFSTSLRACSSTTSGACTLSACPNVDGGMPEVGAGTITVSGGLLTAPITFTADGTGSSGGFSGTTQIFSPGQTLQVSATGGVVAAFSGTSLPAPADITLTSPNPNDATVSIPISADFVFTWTGGSSGSTVSVNLENQNDTAQLQVLYCAFDATAGTGTVSSSLLTQFGAGINGVFFVFPQSDATLSGSNQLDFFLEGTQTLGQFETHEALIFASGKPPPDFLREGCGESVARAAS